MKKQTWIGDEKMEEVEEMVDPQSGIGMEYMLKLEIRKGDN